MTIRAKFRLTNETRNAYMPDSRVLVFSPVYDPALIEEDVAFAKATPAGKLEITVDNPSAKFELGQNYYLDFTPVDQ